MFNFVNNQFQRFYAFAQEKVNAREESTIAKIGAGGEASPLEGRTIEAKSGDYVGKFRFQASKDVNNNTRALFRQSVIDMFGGEGNIPRAVKEAMLLADYGKGKPLTARRIMLVANAIIETGMCNAFEAEGTHPGEMARIAEEAGYTRKDFGKLNTAANLYAKAFNVPLKDALLLAMDKSSDVHAAMEAGKFYMKDVESFRRGVLANSESAALSISNKTFVKVAVASGDLKCMAKVAKNLAAKMQMLLADPDAMLKELDVFNENNDPLDEVRKALSGLADEFKGIAQRIENGELSAEKDIISLLLNNANIGKAARKFEPVVVAFRSLAVDAPGLKDVADLLAKISTRMTAEQDALQMVFKSEFAEREFPVALQKLTAASNEAGKNAGKPLAIPDSIVTSLKNYISSYTFTALENINRFCNTLAKDGDSALHFSDSQKARFKTLLVHVLGAEKAEKALPRLIKELETAFFAECLDNKSGAKIAQHRPETVLAHFEKHPDALKVINLGFDTSRPDQVKAAIKAEMDAQLAKVRKVSPKDITSLSTGMMPQGVREYNLGYVTFNGQNIHLGRTGKSFAEATNSERSGYAEFLEEKFPEGRVKMRQTVSFICGMALGLGGSIDSILQGGLQDNAGLVTGMPRDNCLMNHNTNMLVGARHPDENYDITIAGNGDVTVKLTHYVVTTVNALISDDGNMTNLVMLDGQSPLVSMSKMVATVKITNATDAELGNNMPQFEVTGFTQEQL